MAAKVWGALYRIVMLNNAFPTCRCHSKVCWDFYHAAKAGFEALGHAATEIYCQGKPAYIPMDVPAKMFELGKPSPTSLGGWQFWDCVVQQPMQLKLPQLKDAARYLGLQVGERLEGCVELVMSLIFRR